MEARVVLPELLDALPSDDPRAARSRKNLRKINWFMGNFRWIESILRDSARRDCVELGSGDGHLGVALAAEIPDCTVTAIDLAPRPDHWPEGWSWIEGDLIDSIPKRPAPVVLANLILHHFSADELREIGKALNASRRELLVFSEPARRRIHHLQGLALRLTGLDPVTRHDLHISINAGFRDDELPNLLGLDRKIWNIEVTSTFLGAYRMVARRRPT